MTDEQTKRHDSPAFIVYTLWDRKFFWPISIYPVQRYRKLTSVLSVFCIQSFAVNVFEISKSLQQA